METLAVLFAVALVAGGWAFFGWIDTKIQLEKLQARCKKVLGDGWEGYLIAGEAIDTKKRGPIEKELDMLPQGLTIVVDAAEERDGKRCLCIRAIKGDANRSQYLGSYTAYAVNGEFPAEDVAIRIFDFRSAFFRDKHGLPNREKAMNAKAKL